MKAYFSHRKKEKSYLHNQNLSSTEHTKTPLPNVTSCNEKQTESKNNKKTTRRRDRKSTKT